MADRLSRDVDSMRGQPWSLTKKITGPRNGGSDLEIS